MGRLWDGSVFRLKGVWGTINRRFYKEPDILDSLQSLERLYKTGHSIARFGDGEFNLIRGDSLGFQKSDNKLVVRLREVLTVNLPELEIGLPKVFGDLSDYENKSARFWKAYLGMHRKEMINLININKTYCNTNVTRFWSGYKKDEKRCSDIIKAYMRLWNNRDIIFVEGKLTRMGVGNDLFSNAKSIRRIICPAEDAWDKYDKILECIKNYIDSEKNTLFILALGPTATVLAYDMTKFGLQALDLGHIDVQYEYYLRKAADKIALDGKYVNENTAGREVSDEIINQDYLDSIINIID